MPRLPADIRIGLERWSEETHRIELIRNLFKQRFWVRRDGKRSAKMPEATATEIADQIRRRLVGTLELTEQTALGFDTLPDVSVLPVDDRCHHGQVSLPRPGVGSSVSKPSANETLCPLTD